MAQSEAIRSSIRPSLVGIAVAMLALAVSSPAAEAAKSDRVVAVLYFDNNTNDASFDVFQKGFADMLISDLASVDGIKVVERARLQELLDEIALQESKYFDEKTAVKLGKGLGARYAIMGSITGFKPKLRIDVRMIDVASSEVVVSANVKGQESEIFELEQDLVARFVKRMDKRFAPSAQPQTRVPDVDTLLDYSRAVDLADKGLYEDASEGMKKVVSAAPTFVLARVKRQEYAKRLAAAKEKRTAIQSELGAGLAAKVERFVEKEDIHKLDKDTSKIYLAYRQLRGGFILRALDTHLQGKGRTRIVRKGHEKKAKRLLEAYHANTLLLVRELDVYTRRHAQTLPDGQVYVDSYISLPRDDERDARNAGIETRFTSDTSRLLTDLGSFLLLGRYRDLKGEYHDVAPPLAEWERQYRKLGYAHLREAWSRVDPDAADNLASANAAADALETHAEALLLRDKKDQGIAKLQEILDRYPTHHRYDFYEKRIQKLLGMSHDHEQRMLEDYAKGLATCDDMSLRKGLGTMLYRRVKLHGRKGVDMVVGEIERSCKGNDKARRYWSYLYSHSATHAAKLEDCEIFDRYLQRFLDAGGSKSDAAGYRKNYSDCPAP